MVTVNISRRIFIYVLVLVQINLGSSKIDKSLLCSQEYCENYITQNDCPNLSEECQAQNATHSGLYIPAPSFCNCCQFCLTYLDEGEICSQGGLGSPPTGNLCGPGLYCSMPTANSIPKCRRMSSKCHDDQDDYEKRRNEGNLGFLEMKPICDDRGDYGSVFCIPGQTCSCMSDKGEKIFGEVLNERSISNVMSCKCSRMADKMNKLINSKLAHNARCLSDGSYDELQCIENRCFCVFRETGVISMNEIIDIRYQPLSSLPCFNIDIHKPDAFLKPCEKIKSELLETIRQYEDEGFTYLGETTSDCQPDGNYYQVQKSGTRFICVTPEQKQIENFSSTKSEGMNCNCARTRHLLKSKPSAHFIPTCCSNGNWRPIQCRQDKCYCVNPIDGRQNGMEKAIDDVESLDCHTASWQKC